MLLLALKEYKRDFITLQVDFKNNKNGIRKLVRIPFFN